MQNHQKVLAYIFLSYFLLGCTTVHQKPATKEIMLSTDKAALSKLIALEKYDPIHVKWVYHSLKRTPDRWRLQAELIFSKETVNTLLDDYSYLSVTYKFIPKNELGFTWIDQNKKQKLQAKVDHFKRINEPFNNNFAIDCYDTYFFQKGNFKGGGFIVLDEQTILLTMFSDEIN